MARRREVLVVGVGDEADVWRRSARMVARMGRLVPGADRFGEVYDAMSDAALRTVAEAVVDENPYARMVLGHLARADELEARYG